MNHEAKRARDGFKKGSVEMLVLALLTLKEMYGYELSQLIEKMSDGVLVIPEGSLYPALYKLAESGHIIEEKRLVGKRRQRSYYMIQPSGRERLELLLKEYQNVHKALDHMLKEIVEENNERT